MKKISIALLAMVFFACNNEKTGEVKNELKQTTGTISYPYKADFSSDFSMGNPAHSKLVLDFYKAWEDNKLDDMKPLLADSVAASFQDGSKFSGTSDSLISMGKKYRAMMSSVKIRMDAWIPVHSNDKNEDYVLIWTTAFTTDMKGKLDSIGSHEYYLIKNNKIAYWGEYQAKLTAPPPPAK